MAQNRGMAAVTTAPVLSMHGAMGGEDMHGDDMLVRCPATFQHFMRARLPHVVVLRSCVCCVVQAQIGLAGAPEMPLGIQVVPTDEHQDQDQPQPRVHDVSHASARFHCRVHTSTAISNGRGVYEHSHLKTAQLLTRAFSSPELAAVSSRFACDLRAETCCLSFLAVALCLCSCWSC